MTCCKRVLPGLLLAGVMFYLGVMTVQNHLSWRRQRSVRRAGGPWMVFAGQDRGRRGGGGGKGGARVGDEHDEAKDMYKKVI